MLHGAYYLKDRGMRSAVFTVPVRGGGGRTGAALGREAVIHGRPDGVVCIALRVRVLANDAFALETTPRGAG